MNFADFEIMFQNKYRKAVFETMRKETIETIDELNDELKVNNKTLESIRLCRNVNSNDVDLIALEIDVKRIVATLERNIEKEKNFLDYLDKNPTCCDKEKDTKTDVFKLYCSLYR